jgi:ribonuclease E
MDPRRRLLISVDAAERRIALMNEGRLERLSIEAASDVANRGNVYRGVVKRVEPSLQAAFVDYGGGRDGFLPADEVHPNLYPKGVDGRAPIQKVLRARQGVLVQVTKDEIGTKGAALTTNVSLAGRFLVLMPETERTGISRKLSDAERKRIKEVLQDVALPEGFGVIARTAASSITKADASRDLQYLLRLWQGIGKRFEKMKGAGLIYQESNSVIRFVRDHFDTDIEEVWIDDQETWQEVSDFVSVLMPRQTQKVRLYTDDVPLFSYFGAEEQVDIVFERTVSLPSGGSIVIDETEALVAIDVNSGKTKERNADETVLQANIEAAEEIALQAQLRDLGGLLVLDFIDMRDAAHCRKVEAALKAAFKRDKARTRFGRLSSFGLLEMSRQRMSTSLHSKAFLPCAHCEGTGQVRTDVSAAVALLRRIAVAAAQSKTGFVEAHLPPSLAHYLLNERRRELTMIERNTGTRIAIYGDPEIVSRAVRFETQAGDGPKQAQAKPAVVQMRRDAPDGNGGAERDGAGPRRTLGMYGADLVEKSRSSANGGVTPENVARRSQSADRSAAGAASASHGGEPADRRRRQPHEELTTPEPTVRQPAPVVEREAAAKAQDGQGGAEKRGPLRWLRRLLGSEGNDAPPVAPPARSILVPAGAKNGGATGAEEQAPSPAEDAAAAGTAEETAPAPRRGRRRGGRGRRPDANGSQKPESPGDQKPEGRAGQKPEGRGGQKPEGRGGQKAKDETVSAAEKPDNAPREDGKAGQARSRRSRKRPKT